MKQDIRSFFKSKTNWTSLTAIVVAGVSYGTDVMTLAQMAQSIMVAISAICLKDAVHAKS